MVTGRLKKFLSIILYFFVILLPLLVIVGYLYTNKKIKLNINLPIVERLFNLNKASSTRSTLTNKDGTYFYTITTFKAEKMLSNDISDISKLAGGSSGGFSFSKPGEPNLPITNVEIEISKSDYDKLIKGNQLSVVNVKTRKIKDKVFASHVAKYDIPIIKDAKALINNKDLVKYSGNYEKDATIYSNNKIFPYDNSRYIGGVSVYNDLKQNKYIISVSYLPFSYNPVTTELFTNEIEIKIEPKPQNLSYIINNSNKNVLGLSTTGYNQKIIMIGPKDFYDTMQKYINNRNGKGFTTAYVYTEDIYSKYGTENPAKSIKRFIIEQVIPFSDESFLLLVGDDSIVPPYRDSSGHPIDTYYGTTDFIDTPPSDSIYNGQIKSVVSRLPASNIDELNNVLNKIFLYEDSYDPTNPQVYSNEFSINITPDMWPGLAYYFDYNISFGFPGVIDYSWLKLYRGYSYDHSDAFYNTRTTMYHPFGHANWMMWCAARYNLDDCGNAYAGYSYSGVYNINSMTNTSYPVIVAGGCSTMDGNAAIHKAAITNQNGAVATIGQSDINFVGKYERLFFGSLLSKDYTHLDNVFMGGVQAENKYEVLNIRYFGDPAMKLNHNAILDVKNINNSLPKINDLKIEKLDDSTVHFAWTRPNKDVYAYIVLNKPGLATFEESDIDNYYYYLGAIRGDEYQNKIDFKTDAISVNSVQTFMVRSVYKNGSVDSNLFYFNKDNDTNYPEIKFFAPNNNDIMDLKKGDVINVELKAILPFNIENPPEVEVLNPSLGNHFLDSNVGNIQVKFNFKTASTALWWPDGSGMGCLDGYGGMNCNNDGSMDIAYWLFSSKLKEGRNVITLVLNSTDGKSYSTQIYFDLGKTKLDYSFDGNYYLEDSNGNMYPLDSFNLNESNMYISSNNSLLTSIGSYKLKVNASDQFGKKTIIDDNITINITENEADTIPPSNFILSTSDTSEISTNVLYTETGDDGNDGTAQRVIAKIQVGEAQRLDWDNSSEIFSYNISTDKPKENVKRLIQNLSPDTTYTIEARIYDESNNFGYGVATFKTNQIKDTIPPVLSPEVIKISNTTIQVKSNATDNTQIKSVVINVNNIDHQTEAPNYDLIYDISNYKDKDILNISFSALDVNDNLASKTISYTIDKQDTTNPNINIIDPTNGQEIDGNYTIKVTASDDVSISEVRLYVNNNDTLMDYTANNEYQKEIDFSQYSAGSNIDIKAVAADTSSNKSEANITIKIKGDTPPPPTEENKFDISISSPTEGSEVSNEGFTITGRADCLSSNIASQGTLDLLSNKLSSGVNAALNTLNLGNTSTTCNGDILKVLVSVCKDANCSLTDQQTEYIAQSKAWSINIPQDKLASFIGQNITIRTKAKDTNNNISEEITVNVNVKEDDGVKKVEILNPKSNDTVYVNANEMLTNFTLKANTHVTWTSLSGPSSSVMCGWDLSCEYNEGDEVTIPINTFLGDNQVFSFTANDGNGNEYKDSVSINVKIREQPPEQDTISPVVTIIAPTNNSEVDGIVSIKVDVTDNVKVSFVKAIVNETNEYTLTNSSGSEYVASIDFGGYTKGSDVDIKVIATDTSNNNGAQNIVVRIKQEEKPSECPNGVNDATISITKPQGGSSYKINEDVVFEVNLDCRQNKMSIVTVVTNKGNNIMMDFDNTSGKTTTYKRTWQFATGGEYEVYPYAIITDIEGQSVQSTVQPFGILKDIKGSAIKFSVTKEENPPEPNECQNGVNDAVVTIIKPSNESLYAPNQNIEFELTLTCRMGKVAIPYLTVDRGYNFSLDYITTEGNKTIYKRSWQYSDVGEYNMTPSFLITDADGNTLQDIKGSYHLLKKVNGSNINIKIQD